MRAEQVSVNSKQVTAGSGANLVVMLPRVWAVGERAPVGRKRPCSVGVVPKLNALPLRHSVSSLSATADSIRAEASSDEAAKSTKLFVVPQLRMDLTLYRKYTEAVVRRYGLLSLEAGRVPSLIGRELFRGKVSSYKVQSFEDVVIFCHDVEKCLNRLTTDDQKLIKRVTLQQYTLSEASMMLGLSLRSCVRQYLRAVDRLTRLLLEARLLEPLKCCQEGKKASNDVSASKGAS